MGWFRSFKSESKSLQSALTSSELLVERVEQLERKSFQELWELPSEEDEEFFCSDGRTMLGVWKDVLGPAELRIVVQAYKPRMLGLGTTQAVGFRITPQEIQELEEGELQEFL
jgi:hypothetical protein